MFLFDRLFLKKGSYDLKRNSIIRIIYRYMYHLNVSLNYLKIYKTHYIIGQGEYSLEYKWTLNIIKYLFVDMWARTHGWLRA